MKEGFYRDDGIKVAADSIPIPSLCLSCTKHKNEEIACTLTRMDQMDEIQNEELFCCFDFEPIDPKINKEIFLDEMKKYLRKKHESLKQQGDFI